ncbi:MAG: response regulator [Terracidiphilus sp.]
MPDIKASLLIVDDALSIRMVLSEILESNGYATRSAEDGFSALAEIRREVPDFLISDLNMPGMSGFELLRVVRRRFPTIQVIAMSGAFSGDAIPSGVFADAFYQKGRALGDLLKMMKSLPSPARWAQQPPAAPAPVWISRYERNAAGEGYATIECSECLRAFPKVLNGAIDPINEANCLFCGSQVRYSILQSDNQASLLPFQHEHSSSTAANQPMQELEL